MVYVQLPTRNWLNIWFWFSFSLFSSVLAYEVPIVDKDYSRQICSGMWGGPSTYINVTFDAASHGQVAMVIYEWSDAVYLGKERQNPTEDLPKVYVCTSSAVTGGYCTRDQLGQFILNLPHGKGINETSFWSAKVELPGNKTSITSTPASTNGLWNNPSGNPTPPPSKYTSPWRRSSFPVGSTPFQTRQLNDPISDALYSYDRPIQYHLRKTGFYCVAIVPLSRDHSSTSQRADADVAFHASYTGKILFKNTFEGKLPATDYPKVNFYFVMFLIYSLFGILLGWFCYRHLQDLLPIQFYLSGLVALLIVEMFATWGYYRYLNAHGKNTASTVFLIVVAILDAGRNSMSFFMLLVVSLGLSVVRESLGRTMLKCQALALAHFVFGILYAIGIVELELESTSALILLLFIIPLAFTLSGFLLWIMYSLNATIIQLRTRKQRYKLKMFQRLHYILLFAVVVIAIFFVVSSMSFSGRLAEDYAAKTWRVRWWLLDGWLALLYLVVFTAIAFLWRPNEIAQDEEDAEDYDLEAIQSRSHHRDDDDDDAATLVGGRHGGPDTVAGDHVVFEIGDEDDDDDDGNKKRKAERLSGEIQSGEREGLIGHP